VASACPCLVGPSSLVDLVFCADDAREASGLGGCSGS
jgi:hypothetical protein